tara:strand:- start:983 stop:1939 length:957 start_codon:yes stop_codon:yes gene_type:complete
MYDIYSDSLIEGDWFKSLSDQFKDAKIYKIKNRNKNIKVIEDLLIYDKIDIILLKNKKPILTLEKTREVPTGHNVGQRMARLVRSTELQIPTIYFFPFGSMKHGEYAGICQMNARLLLAFQKIWKIHNCPIVALNWLSDENGEVIQDGTENNEISNLINILEKDSFKASNETFQRLKIDNKNEYLERVKKYKSYSKKPPSVYEIRTQKFFKKFEKKLSDKAKDNLVKRNNSIVYKIELNEKTIPRQDPYTGMQFIYDYCYCRNGKSVNDKKKNLILQFPKIEKEVWLKKNPNNPNSKSSNWYLTANLLLFKDGDIFLR